LLLNGRFVSELGVRQETPMRRWYLPLTVIGLGGIGAFLLSPRGRAVLRDLLEKFQQAPDRLLEDWNDNFENELERIQLALNQIAESLDPNPELGQ
jgi:hypothetical protein